MFKASDTVRLATKTPSKVQMVVDKVFQKDDGRMYASAFFHDANGHVQVATVPTSVLLRVK